MSVAIQLDEAHGTPNVRWWSLGDGDERIEALRARYLEDGPFRSSEFLTAKQRDILGLLRTASEALSNRDMYHAFDALPRTWLGHDVGSLSMCLVKLERRGLVERTKLQEWPFTSYWRVLPKALRAEALEPSNVVRLSGVGTVTGAHYRRPTARFTRPTQTCRMCGAPFRARQRRDTCSERCDLAQNLADAERAELDGLIAEQERQQRLELYARGERPIGSPSLYAHDGVIRLDAPLRGKDGDALDRYATVGGSGDPAHVVEALEDEARRHAILGDVDIEDVARINDATLDHLRDRLREEGLVSISVLRGERERLREPQRHRASAPAPHRTQMTTSYKHRKPGHQSSAGGSRGSRKSRKRWAREAGEW